MRFRPPPNAHRERFCIGERKKEWLGGGNRIVGGRGWRFRWDLVVEHVAFVAGITLNPCVMRHAHAFGDAASFGLRQMPLLVRT